MKKRTIVEVIAGAVLVAGVATLSVASVSAAGERDAAQKEASILSKQVESLHVDLSAAGDEIHSTERDGLYSVCIGMYITSALQYDIPESVYRRMALDYCADESNWIDGLIEAPSSGDSA